MRVSEGTDKSESEGRWTRVRVGKSKEDTYHIHTTRPSRYLSIILSFAIRTEVSKRLRSES